MPTMQTTDDLRAEWAERGDELTAAHIQAHPGSRPPGWWSFSAPEPRRRRIGTMQLRNGIDPDAQVHALGSTGPKARFDRANYEFVAATDAVHPFDNPERRKHVERASKRPEAHTNFAADAYSL
ncbi:MAG: hypothetical protein IID33_14525, partial [Planctomycetes bacterium]|nr:hypothetical protein [Planctomycetota bacterium]